jgi:hypothetical protein
MWYRKCKNFESTKCKFHDRALENCRGEKKYTIPQKYTIDTISMQEAKDIMRWRTLLQPDH